MYFHNFKLDVNNEELDKELFKQSKEFLEKETIRLQEEIFSVIADDLEVYMYERLENIQERYFNEIVAFLLGKSTYYVSPESKVKLREWLKGLGFTEESFRRKIYEENKEDIIEQIQYDAAYELTQNMFNRSHFRSWDFGDISRGYPQSKVIRGFIDALVEKDGFQEYITELLDERNKRKFEYLQRLKSELKRIEEEIEAI